MRLIHAVELGVQPVSGQEFKTYIAAITIIMDFEGYLGVKGHSSILFHHSIPLIPDSSVSRLQAD